MTHKYHNLFTDGSNNERRSSRRDRVRREARPGGVRDSEGKTLVEQLDEMAEELGADEVAEGDPATSTDGPDRADGGHREDLSQEARPSADDLEAEVDDLAAAHGARTDGNAGRFREQKVEWASQFMED